ncbi:GNAT family N-acetyltransferase [Neorhizobium sp. LMR1-1-1.1]|jgi:ribosomal protein S18 acetylase RimI-like enzyme
MTHILDRPAWNALATVHSAFAEGTPHAKRYSPSIVPFAAMQDDTAESIAAIKALPLTGETMALVEAGPIPALPGFETIIDATLVQMLADKPFDRIEEPRIVKLGEEDAADMLALATLTKPGPFTLKAQSLGTFWGIRIDGRLVAMGGQRMRQPGFAELSGLCVHPDCRGKGLGKLMLRFVAGEISAGNEAVYLHAYKHNEGAVGLYRSLGFAIRSDMNFRVVKRAE